MGAMLIAPAAATQDEVGTTAVYTIKHPNSNNCVDTNDAREVFLAPCDGTATQQWDNYTPGRFKNSWYSLCLTTRSSVAGRFAYIVDCVDAVRWVIS